MRVIAPGPTRKNVFKEVARLRSGDSEVLLRKNRILGAVYLLGYSIECYLKFAICERNEWPMLPDIVRIAANMQETRLYVHDWRVLVEVAGIRSGITQQREINAIYSAACDQWGPGLRYRTAHFAGREGHDLYTDLTALYTFLKDLVP